MEMFYSAGGIGTAAHPNTELLGGRLSLLTGISFCVGGSTGWLVIEHDSRVCFHVGEDSDRSGGKRCLLTGGLVPFIREC